MQQEEIVEKAFRRLREEFTEERAEGAVIQVMGPVVDVEFGGRLPAINNLLRAGDKDTGLPLEAVQLLGEGIVRTIALDSSDALARGTRVFDTGMPISVPTGPEILGRLEIAAAIADGLAAAHGKGIIHRDLKPDNVFFTSDGRVKILDFGLARLAASPLVEAQTFTSPPPGTLAGAVLGTVGYMAPAQVRGEPADGRSDIFALGCVLYEVLTGERAFKRDTAAETMAAILREPAPEVSVSGVEAIPEVNRVLGRCLEKQSAQRFQSAADLAFGLRSLVTDRAAATMATVAATAGIAGPPSMVVLPFENLSPDPDNAFFAAGLTEELIADVSKVRALRVISRTSAMHFKGPRSSWCHAALPKPLTLKSLVEHPVKSEPPSSQQPVNRYRGGDQ